MPIPPTCIYGHGELKEIPTDGAVKFWAMLTPDTEKMLPVRLFSCPTCCYVETFLAEGE